MKGWLDKNKWNELDGCFGTFAAKNSWNALKNTIILYRIIAKETAAYLGYTYCENLDNTISAFLGKLESTDEKLN